MVFFRQRRAFDRDVLSADLAERNMHIGKNTKKHIYQRIISMVLSVSMLFVMNGVILCVFVRGYN